MFALSLVAISLVVAAVAQDVNVTTVANTLKADGVIPDVLPANFTPVFPFEVVFGNITNPIPVTAGMNLTMSDTATMPNFAILANNTAIIGKPYLITIVDPDAPSPPNRSEAQFLHFIGPDYISNALTNGTVFVLLNTSAAIEEFVPPTPPAGSIAHRYVVSCYLQNSTGIKAPASFNASNRANFNLTTFISEIPGLTLLGATVFWVAPGANGTTALPNSSATAAAPGSSSTAPSSSGGAASPSGSSTAPSSGITLTPPAIWTLLVGLLGTALYGLQL